MVSVCGFSLSLSLCLSLSLSLSLSLTVPHMWMPNILSINNGKKFNDNIFYAIVTASLLRVPLVYT